jgi:heme A synthase
MPKLTTVLLPVLVDLEQKVETKVKAAGAAATVTGFLVTLIGSLAVFHGGPVPTVITSLVGALATGGLTFAAGWLARHTPRTPPGSPVNVTMLPSQGAAGGVLPTTQTFTAPVVPPSI